MITEMHLLSFWMKYTIWAQWLRILTLWLVLEPLQVFHLALCKFMSFKIQSLWPSEANMRQWSARALIHIITCRLLGTKPISAPMMAYYQFGAKEQTSVCLQPQYNKFSLKNMNLKITRKVVAILSRPRCVDVISRLLVKVNIALMWR